MAASTAARRMIDRHGGGNLMHCSRNSSSWIRVHMPSGTSRNIVSNRRTMSSSSTPATTGGAWDGPAPGSSKRRLCAGLSGPAGRAAASSLRCLPPRGGLSCSHCTGALYNSTSCPRGAKSAHAPNKQQQMVSVSIHQTYALVYQNHNINHNIQIHNIPLWSKTSLGGSTISGSPRKSTPA
jgi:hypothetical protein